LDKLLSDQANVIVDGIEERMDKTLGEKSDLVITKLDAVLRVSGPSRKKT
jgi:hypothetical protein